MTKANAKSDRRPSDMPSQEISPQNTLAHLTPVLRMAHHVAGLLEAAQATGDPELVAYIEPIAKAITLGLKIGIKNACDQPVNMQNGMRNSV